MQDALRDIPAPKHVSADSVRLVNDIRYNTDMSTVLSHLQAVWNAPEIRKHAEQNTDYEHVPL